MNKYEWSTFQWLQHKAIHWLYDLLVWLHDALLEYACVHDLWRRPEEKEIERESEQE